MPATDEKLQKATVAYIEDLRRDAKATLSNYHLFSDFIFDNAIKKLNNSSSLYWDGLVEEIVKDKRYKDIQHSQLHDMVFQIHYFLRTPKEKSFSGITIVELLQLADFFIDKMLDKQYISHNVADILYTALLKATYGEPFKNS